MRLLDPAWVHISDSRAALNGCCSASDSHPSTHPSTPELSAIFRNSHCSTMSLGWKKSDPAQKRTVAFAPTDAFFEFHTPQSDSQALPSPSANTASHASNGSTVVKLGRFDSSVDYVEAQTPPEVQIALRPKSFFFFVATTCIFIGTFTAVAYHGIVMKHVYDSIGSSKVADEIVETYNTTSGFIMALVEVLVGLHMENFMPVFTVYLHNALWFLTKVSDRFRLSRRAHTTILFMFPVLLMLTLGNSLRGLQAGHSTVGFESIMTADDLKKEQPALDLLRAAAAANKTKNSSTTVTVDQSQTRGVNDIILKNAIRAETSPFTFATASPCVQSNDSFLPRGARAVQLNVHDLDSISVVYGFTPQEWNSEAVDQELVPTSQYSIQYKDILAKKSVAMPTASEFAMQTAFEIFLQGKVMIEKAIGDAVSQNHSCSESDYLSDGVDDAGSNATTTRRRRFRRLAAEASSDAEEEEEDDGYFDDDEYDYDIADDSLNQWRRDENGTRICEGAISSLFDLLEYDQSPESQTMENLMHAIADGLEKSLPDTFDVNATELLLENFDISPQIHVQAMRIDTVLAESIMYGLTPETLDCSTSEEGCDGNERGNTSVYLFSLLANAFCGSANCAFLDASDSFSLQKEVGMIPYMVNCSEVQYSSDFHGFYPTDCDKEQNAALLYGIGSYIAGEEYGSNDETYATGLPYIIAPRRHVRFTFAKLTWKFEDVAENFKADCDHKTTQGNCQGLWYQLQPSGRYLFAGQSAIPSSKIMKADFKSPISLVQLNAPSIYIAEWNSSVELERLNASHFTTTHWNPKKNETLAGDACSMLIDSYLNQVESNNYFLERPLQAMYTSAFYYLMANAGVTELNDTSTIVNGTASTSTLSTTTTADALGNTRLKGDQQLRKIRVLIPKNSFLASFAGLMLLVVIMLVVLIFPTRRVEYFADDTSKAQEYIAVATNETYPSAVYKKSLDFPASGEQVPFEDYAVEGLALVHESRRGHSIQL